MRTKHLLLILILPVYIGCNNSNDTSLHSSEVTNETTVVPIVVHDTVYLNVPEAKPLLEEVRKKSSQDELTYQEAMEAAEAHAKSKNPFYGTTVLSGKRVDEK